MLGRWLTYSFGQWKLGRRPTSWIPVWIPFAVHSAVGRSIRGISPGMYLASYRLISTSDHMNL